MNDEHILVEISVNETVETNVHVSDILHAVNKLPLTRKWNVIAAILRELHLETIVGYGDEALTDYQKDLIKKFLERQLAAL